MNGGTERREARGESGNTHNEVQQLQRRTTSLWVAMVALAVALTGVVGYGYLALEKHNIKLSQLPGVQESLKLVGERVDAVEGKLSTWAADWDLLQARMEKLDRRVNYSRELARTEARKLASQVQERLEAELDEYAQGLDARLALLESSHEAQRARLGQLREEVAAVRRDTGLDLARLHQQVSRGERNLDNLARSLEPRRVEFELSKERTRELAAGISLRITGTDVRFQRVKGWLWLLPDRRTLWVRGLQAQQPLRFYRKEGGEPSELVITQVGKDSVAGYLLLPAHRSPGVTAERAPTTSETEAAVPALLAQ